MLLTNAIGKERQILSLLKILCPDLTQIEMDAWLQLNCSNASIFCIQDNNNNRIDALMIVEKRTLSIEGKKGEVSVLTQFLVHPDFDPLRAFFQLLDASIDAASRNSLLILTHTDNPVPLETRGFQVLNTILESDLENFFPEPEPHGGELWKGDVSLYPAYQQFMTHFDGAVYLEEGQFDQTLDSHLLSGGKIHFSKNEDDIPDAFALIRILENKTYIETIVYGSIDGLHRLLAYFGTMFPHPILRFTKSENLQEFFPLFPRESGYLMAYCPNPALVSHWLNRPCEDCGDIFNGTSLPSWNQLL